MAYVSTMKIEDGQGASRRNCTGAAVNLRNLVTMTSHNGDQLAEAASIGTLSESTRLASTIIQGGSASSAR